jgi:hypothetical protein
MGFVFAQGIVVPHGPTTGGWITRCHAGYHRSSQEQIDELLKEKQRRKMERHFARAIDRASHVKHLSRDICPVNDKQYNFRPVVDRHGSASLNISAKASPSHPSSSGHETNVC